MEVEFDLPVVTDGRPKGNKKSRHVLATVPVEVSIGECDPIDLTPVASVCFHPGEPKEYTGYFHNRGHIYRPLGPVTELPRTFRPYEKDGVGFVFRKAERTVRMLVDNWVFGGSGLYPPKLFNGRKASLPLEPQPLETLRLEAWRKEPVALQVEEFRERCNRLLACEGVVYATVAEPAIGVDLLCEADGGGMRASIRPVARSMRGFDWRSKSVSPPHALFRLDEMDRMMDFCRMSGVEAEVVGRWDRRRVVVQDAAVLSLDSDRASVYAAAARTVMQGWGKNWLADHPLVDDLFRLVECHREGDVPDELGDALSGVVDLHRDGTRVFENEAEAIAVGHVAAMWDARAIDLGSGPAVLP